MNKIDGSTAVCEIELKSGRLCEVQAIGRCATCERAFCLTHQATWYDGAFLVRDPSVDRCAPCYDMKKAEEYRRLEEDRAPYMYFLSGAARAALLASRVQPVKIYEGEMRFKKKFFGGYQEVKNVICIGHGWLLGELAWKYTDNVYSSAYRIGLVRNHLTALLDLSHDHTREQNYRITLGIARVQPYSEGYKVAESEKDNYNFDQEDGWREAMQIIKRLTEKSS